MKRALISLLSLLLVAVMLLSSCAPIPDGNPDDTANPEAEETTTAKKTDPIVEEILIPRPEKDVVNILMIGHSLCFYYVEELAGIAAANGKEINVCNFYYSGCSLEQHWNFYLNNSRETEFFITTDKDGKKGQHYTLIEALDYAKRKLGSDWDVISLQDTKYYTLVEGAEGGKAHALPYAEKLYDLIRQRHPDTMLYWHQFWAYELGWGIDKEDPREHVDTPERQLAEHNAIKELAYTVAEAEGVNVIPSGDAWVLAWKNPKIGQTLCYRLRSNNNLGDKNHDGDIGGGQYLNACVWYEVLFAESCLGNTWRPLYDLSEEKIAILQQAAHDAVAAVYGADYARTK